MNDKFEFSPCCLSSTVAKFSKENITHLISRTKTETGFDQLDAILGGGISPGLTVLGAVSGLGKSTLMLQIAEHISSEGTPVLFFSLEMSRDMIAAKAISRMYFQDIGCDEDFGLTANALTSVSDAKKLDKKLWETVDKVNIKSEKLYIIERADVASKDKEQNVKLSAVRIKSIVADFIERQRDDEPKPVVIVDYLQILPPDNNPFAGSDKQQVDITVQHMTELAMAHNLPVVLVSSLNRTAYKAKVQYESLKESGGIEYSADVILGLSFSAAPEEVNGSPKLDLKKEKAEFPRKVELSVLKQRYGGSGSESVVQMDYYAKFDYFTQRDVKPSKKLKKQPYDKSQSKTRHSGWDNFSDAPEGKLK
ncbi:hypothetical protein LJC34_01950 [Oscillospiraceae bacterium OttesenSCG-928-G22]|nr:hypothetical protein [Oscillospiraceae bacterium OttesenSCG-928-G22]